MLTPLALKKFLRERQYSSLQELGQTFHEDPEFIQDMLKPLVRKGQVHMRMLTPDCGTKCNSCGQATTVIYEISNPS